jgi:hypothetical protein
MDVLKVSPERFKSVFDSLSEPEQQTMIQILQELQETGESPTYENVWLQDYEEIPVDIDTFLESDEYLGKATRQGTQIYTFWRQTLREMFSGGDMEYEEIAFTGAIGIGKTAIAVYAIAYLTYRLLCLKNPQGYFGFADTDDIAIFFFNATVALAYGVGFGRLHACLLESPWFLEHGHKAGSSSNPYYVPDKHVVIKAGSKGSHGLGQQIYCIVGSTEIITDSGIKSIEDLAGTAAKILQRTQDGGFIWVTAPIIPTKMVHDTIRITLEDGTVIEGTPEHQVMLSDGSYKMLKDLTESDDLFATAEVSL